MRESTHRFWYRSSPVAGAVGGFLSAMGTHLFGETWVPEWLHGLHLESLFDTAPAVGYVLFVAGGTVLGWLFRRIEDRYVYG